MLNLNFVRAAGVYPTREAGVLTLTLQVRNRGVAWTQGGVEIRWGGFRLALGCGNLAPPGQI